MPKSLIEPEVEVATASAKGIVTHNAWRDSSCPRPSRMTQAVRVSLGVLRAYLILMMLMLGYHVLDLSDLLHKIH
jgi:hypothetical protein